MIFLEAPGLPPSTNNAFIKGRNGVRSLSPEGRKYKTELTNYLVRAYPGQLKLLTTNEPYLIYILFQFAEVKTLLNLGYPKSAANRYKKLDVSNRLKLLEDCISDASAVDDSHYWTVIGQKALGPSDHTFVWIWPACDSPFRKTFEELHGERNIHTIEPHRALPDVP